MGQLSIFHGNISHGHGTLHGRVEGLRDIRAAVAAHLVELLVAGAVHGEASRESLSSAHPKDARPQPMVINGAIIIIYGYQWGYKPTYHYSRGL